MVATPNASRYTVADWQIRLRGGTTVMIRVGHHYRSTAIARKSTHVGDCEDNGIGAKVVAGENSSINGNRQGGATIVIRVIVDIDGGNGSRAIRLYFYRYVLTQSVRRGNIIIGDFYGHRAGAWVVVIANRKIQRVRASFRQIGHREGIRNLVVRAGGHGQCFVRVPGAACGEAQQTTFLQRVGNHGTLPSDGRYDEVIVRDIRDGIALRVFDDAVVGQGSIGMSICGIYSKKPRVGEEYSHC